MKKAWIILVCGILFLAGCSENNSGKGENYEETAPILSGETLKEAETAGRGAAAEGDTVSGKGNAVRSAEEYIAQMSLCEFPAEGMSAEEAAAYQAQQESLKAYYGIVYDEPLPTQSVESGDWELARSYHLYRDYYAVADDSQKVALDAYRERNQGDTSIRVNTRELRMIMGEVPEDQPRITLEKAEELWQRLCDYCNTHPQEAKEVGAGLILYRMLNEVTGGPDEEGGSGVNFCEYYMDETGWERIHLEALTDIPAIIYKKHGADGQIEWERIGSSKDLEVYYETIKKTWLDRSWYGPGTEFFDSRYQSASAEQKVAMINARKELCDAMNIREADREYFTPDREILMITGELPENTPHLTLEQVMKIVEELKTDPAYHWTRGTYYKDIPNLTEYFMERFNEIAGAPDVHERVRLYEEVKDGTVRYYLADVQGWYVELVSGLRFWDGENLYKIIDDKDLFIEP